MFMFFEFVFNSEFVQFIIANEYIKFIIIIIN